MTPRGTPSTKVGYITDPKMCKHKGKNPIYILQMQSFPVSLPRVSSVAYLDTLENSNSIRYVTLTCTIYAYELIIANAEPIPYWRPRIPQLSNTDRQL